MSSWALLLLVALLLLLQVASKPQHVTFRALQQPGINELTGLGQYDRNHADRGTDKWLPSQPSWAPDNQNCLHQKTQCSSVASGSPAMAVDGNVESSFVWAGRYNQSLVLDLQACHRISRIKIRTLTHRTARDIHKAVLYTGDSPGGPWKAVMPHFEVSSRTYNYKHAATNYTTIAQPPARHQQALRTDFEFIPRGAGSLLWQSPPGQPNPSTEHDGAPVNAPSWSVGSVPNAPAIAAVASEQPPHLSVYSAPLGKHTHVEILDDEGLYTQSLNHPSNLQQARTGGPTYTLGDGDLPMEGKIRGFRPDGHESQFINTDFTGPHTLVPYSWNEFQFAPAEGRFWRLFVHNNYGDKYETGFNEIGFWGQECPGN